MKKMLDTRGMDDTIQSLRQRRSNPLPGIWDKNTSAARDAWREVTKLDESHLRCMQQLSTRQCAMRSVVGESNILLLEAQSVAPFTTGLGNEHPLENGFAFLNPYGLAYLPGSGVKGVVRRAAQELASGEWGDTGGWDGEDVFDIEVSGQSLPLSTIDVLFGREPPSGGQHHIRGALSFWDVIPQIKGRSLSVEIMTPHQGHYYQRGESPHDSGQPNPISFLTVPPGSRFTFHVTCSRGHLGRHAPVLLRDERWKALIEAAFAHAFEWLGFGAKTAVGYGAMEIDPHVEEAKRRQAAEEADAARRRAEQAAFDALPESRRLLTGATRTLDAISSSDRIDENLRNEAKTQANRLADEALAWSDASEREEATTLLERLYEVIGWSDPGKKKKQREKQIKKRRDAIARIRDV
ncbi:MAG: type III-B CRISPR module RAMP protein Cmr6 [Pseudomonadales bacterium]|nr:type III-B CRISPR module RAMP protein Cmr6 [Pseudomonadales bacterium]